MFSIFGLKHGLFWGTEGCEDLDILREGWDWRCVNILMESKLGEIPFAA
jgi:hypothetical protein